MKKQKTPYKYNLMGGHDELKKTIHLKDGSRVFVYELFFPTTRKKRKHQYDWEYKREHFFKFHSEWHTQKLTKPILITYTTKA